MVTQTWWPSTSRPFVIATATTMRTSLAGGYLRVALKLLPYDTYTTRRKDRSHHKENGLLLSFPIGTFQNCCYCVSISIYFDWSACLSVIACTTAVLVFFFLPQLINSITFSRITGKCSCGIFQHPISNNEN